MLHLTQDRWLELRASRDALEDLCGRMERLRNGDHAHLYSGSIGLIVEADDTWPGIDRNDG
jgi:hypothetical protein